MRNNKMTAHTCINNGVLGKLKNVEIVKVVNYFLPTWRLSSIIREVGAYNLKSSTINLQKKQWHSHKAAVLT